MTSGTASAGAGGDELCGAPDAGAAPPASCASSRGAPARAVPARPGVSGRRCTSGDESCEPGGPVPSWCSRVFATWLAGSETRPVNSIQDLVSYFAEYY